MTTDDREFARKIVTYLDKGAGALKTGTAYRLQLARQEALARLSDPQHVADLQLAGAHTGGGTGTTGANRRFWASGRLWIGIALIVAVGIGVQQWQAYTQLKELEETDLAILSSDLPIDAYLDRGFQNWLKHAVDE